MASEIWRYGYCINDAYEGDRSGNQRLKKMYAEQRLKAEIIQEPIIQYYISVSFACRTFRISETCYHYHSTLTNDNARVIRDLERIIKWRGKPKFLRYDNGLEYISHKLALWTQKNEIKLRFIQPGNPPQNAYIEQFNLTVRYDWLSHYIYGDIKELQDKATAWLWTYNHERPNMRLGGSTPHSKT